LEFLFGKSVFVYCFIFFGKILEVAVGTSRMVLITKGERIKGSIIAFFEIILWLTITGSVVMSLQDDPLKLVVFACAYAAGNFLGSWLEDKLAFGLSTIEVIAPCGACVDDMLHSLRDHGFAVTVVDGDGKDGKRKLLMMHLRRKRLPDAIRLINSIEADCLITVTDVKLIRGGYFLKK